MSWSKEQQQQKTYLVQLTRYFKVAHSVGHTFNGTICLSIRFELFEVYLRNGHCASLRNSRKLAHSLHRTMYLLHYSHEQGVRGFGRGRNELYWREDEGRGAQEGSLQDGEVRGDDVQPSLTHFLDHILRAWHSRRH